MENKIYNELNREPLVWGVPFASLMINASLLVLSSWAFINLFVVWKGIILAFALNVALYLVLLLYTKVDKIEFYGRFQRAIEKNIDSLSKSSQVLVIK
ncbi:MAG: hypothetical protein KAW12_26210 [Candidatus Aminicenantes bacterium]|nr:hypothetical protein [Candidatus Aminicenantes bacterium]MCK4765720.1 hypothetical protein [Candidatus Aminicenantes bacterium]